MSIQITQYITAVGFNRQCLLCWVEGRKEMFYLTTLSTHFIYGYMASAIWLRTILIVRKETCFYSFRVTARVLLYAPSHRQDSTYHNLCYTSRGALAGTRNSSMGPPHEGSIRRPITTMSERSYHGATSHSLSIHITQYITGNAYYAGLMSNTPHVTQTCVMACLFFMTQNRIVAIFWLLSNKRLTRPAVI